jgi:hypothetical protein
MSLCFAQEPVAVRLRDAVGDTIDLAERDSFHLFPGTAGFRNAAILALPGPEFFAEIQRAGQDSSQHIFLRIMPYDLERIRFLIDNRELIAAQQRSDTAYARALASFWQMIEEHPLRNVAGEPATAQEVPPAPPESVPSGQPGAAQMARPGPPEAVTAGKPQPEPVAVVVRLRDSVGDTIDLAERDSFRLFPNTAGFQRAVILALPGPEFFVEVTLAADYTPRQVFIRITPYQLERIRFLIDNREYAANQVKSDSSAALALASFWQMIEDHPLRNMAGEPAIVQEVHPAPTESVATGKPSTAPEVSPVTPEASPAGEPPPKPVAAVVRLSDAVGDTIDAAERDRFQLFPNTTGFRYAVILSLPGPRFFAAVTRADDDTLRLVYYAILPGQLVRIRFLIDERPAVAPSARSREALALASFWREIEGRPLRDIAGEPATAQQFTPAPTGVAPAGELPLTPVTEENRYNYALHGATCGSIAGSFFWPGTGLGAATTLGLTVAGSTAGYMMGQKYDLGMVETAPLPREGRGWRTCCALGACVPGLTLGVAAAALASRGSLTGIPAYLTGLCVTVEVVTLGYRLGRSLDRSGAP